MLYNIIIFKMVAYIKSSNTATDNTDTGKVNILITAKFQSQIWLEQFQKQLLRPTYRNERQLDSWSGRALTLSCFPMMELTMQQNNSRV